MFLKSILTALPASWTDFVQLGQTVLVSILQRLPAGCDTADAVVSMVCIPAACSLIAAMQMCSCTESPVRMQCRYGASALMHGLLQVAGYLCLLVCLGVERLPMCLARISQAPLPDKFAGIDLPQHVLFQLRQYLKGETLASANAEHHQEAMCLTSEIVLYS